MASYFRLVFQLLVLNLGLALALFPGASDAAATATPPETGKTYVYFGTFTHRADGGIFVAELDPATGTLSPSRVAAHAESPGFLAIDAPNKRVFALDQRSDNGGARGCVDSFEVNPASGELKPTSQQPTTGGPFCFISLDRTRHFLGTARYGDGNVAVFPIDDRGHVLAASSQVQHHGFGPNHARQEAAHVHSINFSPDNRYAIVADLGIDEIRSYRFDSAKGSLVLGEHSRFHAPPGSGPRHLAFHPSGKFVYAVCEVDPTLLALSYDSETGKLKQLQALPLLPAGTLGEQRAAEVVVHPSGNYVYVSNRGYDALIVYSVDPATGQLSFLQREHEGIAHPRNFAIDPSGHWLLCANRDTNNVSVYAIDAATGRLTRTRHKTDVPQPVCVRFYSTK